MKITRHILKLLKPRPNKELTWLSVQWPNCKRRSTDWKVMASFMISQYSKIPYHIHRAIILKNHKISISHYPHINTQDKNAKIYFLTNSCELMTFYF